MKHIDRYKITVFAILALFLIWGFVSFRDYGISWDEEIQRIRGLGGLRTAIEFTLGEDAVPARLKERDVAAISSGSLGIKLPMLILEYATGFRMTNDRVFKIYHLYNFLIFWISALFVYPLLRELGSDEKYGILGLLLYIICPRILADSFYNNKDLAMLSLLTICLYFCVITVLRFSVKKAILLGIVTGMVVNVRTVSAFPVCIFALYYFISKAVTRDKKIILRTLAELTGTGLIAFVVMFFLTPGMWKNLFGTLTKRVTSTFNFSHGGFENVAGIVMNRTQLPWYYLPLSIILTVPCIYIIGMTAGIIAFALKGGKKDKRDHMLWILWGQLIFFVGYPVVMKPMQYNLWRHFYFIFIYMVIFAVYGLRALAGHGFRSRLFVRIFAGVSIMLTIGWIGVNHPFEYLYFNPLFRGMAAVNTDQDYWAVSYRGLLSQIVDGSATDVYIYPTLTGNQLFGERGWENYHLHTLEHSAKYRIVEGNPGDNAFYKILKTVEVDGRICESLIRRENYGNVLRRYFAEGDEITGNMQAGEEIYSAERDGRRELVLKLPEELTVYEVDFLYGDAGEGVYPVSGEKVYVLDRDGREQKLLSEECLMRERDILGVSLDGQPLPGYIRLEYDDSLLSGDPCIEIRVFGSADTSEEGREVKYNRFDGGRYIQELKAEGAGQAEKTEEGSAFGEDAEAMTDGDEETMYSFGGSMTGNERLSFAIGEGFGSLGGLHIGSGDKPLCSGRDIMIEASTDGDSFKTLSWHYGSAGDYLFEEPGDYRYIRISQKGRSSEPWMISELGLIYPVESGN